MILGGVLGCSGKVSDVRIANGGSANGGEPSAYNGGGGGANTGGVDSRAGGGGLLGDDIIGGAGSGGANDSALLIESAWDITVTATWVEPELDVDLPPFPLTLALLDKGPSFTGILSRDGRMSILEVIRQGGARARFQAAKYGYIPFSLGGSGEGALIALMLQTLTLTALDDDSDGIADRLVGTGDGAIERSCGDCSYSSPVTLKVSGKPDRTAPALNLPETPLNPLDELRVSVSEALKSGLLELSGNPPVSLFAGKTDALPIWFTTPTVLPFSGTWNVTGVGRDFAERLLDLRAASVTTLADPGIFAEDGFETAPNVSLTGAAAVVDASSGLPIPSGSHALLLPPGSSATFHIKRTAASASKSTISAHFVELKSEEEWWPMIDFRAAVIGGGRRGWDGHAISDDPLPTTHPIWIDASPAYVAQIVLNEAGNDIGVLIAAKTMPPGPGAPPGALLIDALTLE